MSTFGKHLFFWTVALGLVIFSYAHSFSARVSPQPAGAQGSIQGYVATVLATPVLERPIRSKLLGPQGISFGAPILLPDIKVVAKNDRGFTSNAAVTNPQGYFVITDLPEGIYQICVSGAGYTSQCDNPPISNNGRLQAEVDHPVLIAPSGNAIAGTVWLADQSTPCFWFRPSIDPHPLTAKVSLIDSNKQVVAGPVTANNRGQFVLPTALSGGTGNMHAVCEAGIADAAVQIQAGPTLQDMVINNHRPQILSMDFSKGSVGVRRANPGDTIRVTVQATDADGDTLHYRWSDDNAGNLGFPDTPAVDWKVANAATTNTLHVQVSDGRGGFATLSRTLQSGPDSLLFAGRVFNRQSLTAVSNAIISLNNVIAKTDANGNFRISVPDAPNFVLNVNKPGFALSSQILRTQATNIDIPFDAAQTSTINARTGGSIQLPPPGCPCNCPPHGGGHVGKEGDHDRERDDRDKDDRDKDDRDRDKGRGNDQHNGCKGTTGGAGLSLQFPAGALVTTGGAAYNGTASVEALQYDLTQTNPIPGDFGATYQGKAVRMVTFGAFHVAARDTQGHALTMAPGKKVNVSLPIQTAQLAAAPAVIPFFHYDEAKGIWLEDGTLTRSGNRYVGHIAHFSAFNADTVFPGGACVKVVLDNTFTLPVTLSAVYLDPNSGTFNHNGTQSNTPVIGVERMTPNVNFQLTITDSNNATVSVPLFSGPGLDPTLFPSGLDPDQTNFSNCNGPVQISNKTIPAEPNTLYFLGKVFGGTITDHSANYQQATGAQAGGSRDTFAHWKQANGFPNIDEAIAVYFNNGDLKFGRDMHCRVKNPANNALACYVSNFGAVGTNDAKNAVGQATTYESSGQTLGTPQATVAMEYNPGGNGVQFWAYKGDGSYFINPSPALDLQGAKPMPDICMGCHFGAYDGSNTTNVVNGAVFLPFDVESFKDVNDQLYSATHPPGTALDTQFHILNNMIANTAPPAAVTQLVNLWYANATATTPFRFNQGAAQLPGTPFVDSDGHHHEPLYDNVVKQVCRTCHVANYFPWNQFTLGPPPQKVPGMNGVPASTFQTFACFPQTNMPNAEVPWKNYWEQNKNATLASELNSGQPGAPFQGTGCPNH